MSDDTMLKVIAAALGVLALWSPLLVSAIFTARAHAKLAAILGQVAVSAKQGKDANTRLNAISEALAAADEANAERAEELRRLHGQVVKELQAGRGAVEAARTELVQAAGELTKVVKTADGSFRHLADSMRDFDNLQRMADEVERLANEMAGASAKIESQLDTARKVVTALHGVVDAWSKERAPIEAQTAALAREVEKALAFEREERQHLRLQLNALLVKLGTVDGGPDART